MKKISVIVTTVLILFIFASCGKTDDTETKRKISDRKTENDVNQKVLSREESVLIDHVKKSFVITYDPVVKRNVSSKITYETLITDNCEDVSWSVSKYGDEWEVEVDGYHTDIDIGTIWSDAHVTLVFSGENIGGVYSTKELGVLINGEKELSNDEISLFLDDLLSKVNVGESDEYNNNQTINDVSGVQSETTEEISSSPEITDEIELSTEAGEEVKKNPFQGDVNAHLSGVQVISEENEMSVDDSDTSNDVYKLFDIINLSYGKELSEAAVIVSDGYRFMLGGSNISDLYSGAKCVTYNQGNNTFRVLGKEITDFSIASNETNQAVTKEIDFYIGSEDFFVTRDTVKAAYESYYEQLKEVLGEPTSTIEDEDGDWDYEKIYWVTWENTTVGTVWLCWGENIWGNDYNECVLSFINE